MEAKAPVYESRLAWFPRIRVSGACKSCPLRPLPYLIMASEIKSTDPHLVPESTTKAKEESKPTPFAKPTTREPDDDKTGGDQALSTMSAQPLAKVKS